MDFKRRDFFRMAKMGLIAGASLPAMGAGFQLNNDHVKDFLWLEKKSKPEDLTPAVEPVKAPHKDVVLTGGEYRILKSTLQRLKRLQRVVGYGHFNVLGFDEALRIADRYSKVGNFTQEELLLLEKLFYENANVYGFYGEKVLSSLTVDINEKETKKIPHTGHYLYRGRAEAMYKEIQRDLGSRVILTSGVRGVVKQMYLFLNKAESLNGNLSEASTSLAPPGYSFHGVGDFDVGKVGFGYRNFTADFAKTDEYKRLMDLGYIKIRYYQGNPFGVRFEPWHIKVI